MDENRALIIVDVQPTFCEGGALAVQSGNDTAEKIADFVTDNADEYTLIVTTQDWHIDPGEHFSDSPDFVDTWPPHAIAGTPEAELHDSIASLPIDASVKKGEYEAAYSGFQGIDEDGRSLEDILRQADIHCVDLVGLTESHCLKDTALDSLRLGWPTRVLSDLTVPVSEELGVAARLEMDDAGIEQIASSAAFGFYEEGEDTPIPGDFSGGSRGDLAFGVTSGFAAEFGEDFSEDYADESDSDYEYGEYSDEGYSDSSDSWDDDLLFDTPEDEADEWDEDFLDLNPSASLTSRISAGISSAAFDSSSDFSERKADVQASLSDFNSQEREGSFQDFDLDDFDLGDFDIDEEDIDFSGDADESDFDFSDIDYKPEF